MCSSRTRFPLVDTGQSILFLFCIFWGPESEFPKSPYCGCWVHFLFFSPITVLKGTSASIHLHLFRTDPWKWRDSV